MLHMLGVVNFVDQLVDLYEVCCILLIHIPFDSNTFGRLTDQLMP